MDKNPPQDKGWHRFLLDLNIWREALCWRLNLEFQRGRHNLWGKVRTALGFLNQRQAPLILQRTETALDFGFQGGRKILADIDLILDKD